MEFFKINVPALQTKNWIQGKNDNQSNSAEGIAQWTKRRQEDLGSDPHHYRQTLVVVALT